MSTVTGTKRKNRSYKWIAMVIHAAQMANAVNEKMENVSVKIMMSISVLMAQRNKTFVKVDV